MLYRCEFKVEVGLHRGVRDRLTDEAEMRRKSLLTTIRRNSDDDEAGATKEEDQSGVN